MRRRPSFAGVLLALAVVLVLSPSASGLAQSERTRRTRSPLSIVAVKGVGKARTPEPSRRLADQQLSAVPLQATEVKTAIKAATGKDLAPESEGLTLGPKNPWVNDKGYLLISGSNRYSPEGWYVAAGQSPQTLSSFALEFQGDAGRSYVVDFVLWSSDPMELKCVMPDGSTKNQALSSASGQHALFLIEAATKGWYKVECRLPTAVAQQIALSAVKFAPWN